MVEFVDSFTQFGGERIFCRHVKPVGMDDPKGLVVLIHGFGEHIGRYNEVFEAYSNAGFYVFGHDHMGHGKSSGPRANTSNYENFIQVCKEHMEETSKKYPGKKLFVHGHSMGGLIGVRFTQKHGSMVDGLIMDAPLLGVPDFVPAWKVTLANQLGKMPVLCKTPGDKVDSTTLSHDSAVGKDYDEDPLVYHGKTNAEFLRASLVEVDNAMKNSQSIHCPVLALHGTADKLCPSSATKTFYESIKCNDKTMNLFEGSFHVLRAEPHNGTKESYFKIIVDWCLNHC